MARSLQLVVGAPLAVVRAGDSKLKRSELVERSVYLAQSADKAPTAELRDARLAEAARINQTVVAMGAPAWRSV